MNSGKAHCSNEPWSISTSHDNTGRQTTPSLFDISFVCPETTVTSQMGPPSRGHLLGSDSPGPTRETISGGATPRTRLALVTSSHEPSTTHLSTTKATTSHTLVTTYPNHDEHELHRPSNDEHTKKEQSEFLEKTLWRKIGREDQLIWNEHDHTMALGVAGGVSKLLLLSQSKDYTIERNISVDQRSNSLKSSGKGNYGFTYYTAFGPI